MRKLYYRLLMIVTTAMCLGFAAPALVSADCVANSTQQAIQCGTSQSAGVPVTADPTTSLNTNITNGINLLSVVVGIIAVVMIILGGFRYITSGGKQESIGAAKSTILYAVIGLVVVASAQIIVKFVLVKSTG